MKRRLFALLLSALLLAGCQSADTPKETEQAISYDWMDGESPVPAVRTGVSRQGLGNHNFECTADGVYYIYQYQRTGQSFILYGDHDSDTIIKLCGRADCAHADHECDAFLHGAFQIKYYDGYLYALSSAEAPKLIRMDMTGGNRLTVMDTTSITKEYGYSAAFWPQLSNGVFSVCMGKMDSSGNVTGEGFYWKLDGSMDRFELLDLQGLMSYDLGDYILQSDSSEGGAHSYYLWDPDTNTTSFLTRFYKRGYYSETDAYYLDNGLIVRRNYETDEVETLLDTGLVGNYEAKFFPDCIVIGSAEGGLEADPNLYIYNWAFEPVGQVALNYRRECPPIDCILAETAERIILMDSYNLMPRYYIEKSEFGTEDPAIHSFDLPDLQSELAEYDDDRLYNWYD